MEYSDGVCREMYYRNSDVMAHACPQPLGHDGLHGEVVATIKDSGARQHFDSGMVRDVEEGKVGYHKVLDGPMFHRWAAPLTAGARKYPDEPDGSANWTKADGATEYLRFKRSAFRHFIQWFTGQDDEDHAAAVFFNINGAEYVRQKYVGRGMNDHAE